MGDVPEILSWSDLRDILTHQPLDSALGREMYPDEALWDLDAQLLAAIADGIRHGNWMQSKDGHRGTNRPKPIPRPGVKSDKKYGGKAESIETIKAWLGW